MNRWIFEMKKFGKTIHWEEVISQGVDEAEARNNAKEYLMRGESLGRLVEVLDSPVGDLSCVTTAPGEARPPPI
jgi:hypothetical protein